MPERKKRENAKQIKFEKVVFEKVSKLIKIVNLYIVQLIYILGYINYTSMKKKKYVTSRALAKLLFN